MRMWMCEPAILCRQHLLGEHNEIHKHRHIFERGYKLSGRAGQIEPTAMKTRHDELAEEMIKREYKHNSPYEMPELSAEAMQMKVDKAKALTLLLNKCDKCFNNVTTTGGKENENRNTP